MQIVIDIAQNEYVALEKLDAKYLLHIIKDGKPLPKGHGRLIDGDVLKNQNCCSESYVKLFTIVEADKEEADGTAD